ncbi:MAG TPA: hypothetical protein VHE35_03695 [Kofleriaceae bacterium]|nr:hypothetical protein [Kofleriaceae bacterium]
MRRALRPLAAVATVAVAAAAAALGGCHPASQAPAGRETFVIPPDPAPPPSEHCFRERFQAQGRPFELLLSLRADPPTSTIISQLTEHGANGDATWSTVMTVDGDRFASVEHGPEGDAHGEGTLVGPAWAWTGWTSVTHRPEGFDEHADARFTSTGLDVTTDTRGPDGAVASTGKHHYLAVACLTLGDQPIESLEPKPRR